MKFLIILFLSFISQIICKNTKVIEKRWITDEWPTISQSWMKIGDDFRRRTESIPNRERHRITGFSPIIRDLSESIKNAQEFDPSVVIVNKNEEANPTPFTDFGFGFPFQPSIERPQFWPFGDLFNTHKPWWKGPNVCIERRIIEGKQMTNDTKYDEELEVEADGVSSVNMNFQSIGHSMLRSIHLQSTHCTESDTSYTCISKIVRGKENTTTIVKHECCHGFKRTTNSGCTQVDLKGLVQTLKDLKSNRMLALIEKTGFYEKLVKENITIFSLTDDSLIEYEDNNNRNENEVEEQVEPLPASVRRRRELTNSISDLIPMHLIPGFVKSGDLDDEQLLSSLSTSNKLIRINVYNNPKRVITANCAPVLSSDNYAVNGIVHIIDRVMQRPTKTIAQMIESDSRFSILKNLLLNTDLMVKLGDQSQHLTLFAPTNEALLKLDKLYLDRLLKGQSCVESFLNNHIIANTLCLSAIQEYGSVKNALNILFPIKRVDQKLEINGIKVTETDRLATNGVLHVLDGVLISERSQPFSKYLETHRMTEYLDLIKESGLLEEWDALQNVSIFIPSIDSMRSISTKSLEEIKNKTKEMIGYQVVRPQSGSCDWNSDQMLETISGNQIRVNVFGDIPGFGFRPVTTAQCARIVGPNEKICGANIHIVDQFLRPAKGNLTQVLDSMEKFSIIRQIIKSSGIESELSNGVYTLLAPNDHILLHHFSQNQINSLTNNKTESEKLIRNHLFPQIICCSGVNSSPFFLSTQQFRNLEGSLISAHKSINGRVRFGGARVAECDIMATNGVIHSINRVLETKPSLISSLPFPFEIIF